MAKSVQFKQNGENVYPIVVVEKITNANGTAIKYSDGTMICCINTTVTDQAINTKYGDTALYCGRRTWNFPVPFVDNDISVNCGSFHWGTSGSWGAVYGKPNISNVSLIGYDFYSRASGTNCNIQATAIGRWK